MKAVLIAPSVAWRLATQDAADPDSLPHQAEVRGQAFSLNSDVIHFMN